MFPNCRGFNSDFFFAKTQEVENGAGPNVEAALSTSPTSAASSMASRKPTIGQRKAPPKKGGVSPFWGSYFPIFGHLKACLSLTRQVYNLCQDLWNRLPRGLVWVQSPFGATVKQRDRQDCYKTCVGQIKIMQLKFCDIKLVLRHATTVGALHLDPYLFK